MSEMKKHYHDLLTAGDWIPGEGQGLPRPLHENIVLMKAWLNCSATLKRAEEEVAYYEGQQAGLAFRYNEVLNRRRLR